MNVLLNILWFLCGGWFLAIFWYICAILMTISIIGLPWARACWEIGNMCFSPFGKDIVSTEELDGRQSETLTVFQIVANILWLPFGLVLATLHIIHALALACTIIGIPFAWQTLKIAAISLFPVGKRVVSIELAQMIRENNAKKQLQRRRRPF